MGLTCMHGMKTIKEDKDKLLKTLAELTKKDVEMSAFLVRAKLLGFCTHSACMHAFVFYRRTWKPPLTDEEAAARDAARKQWEKEKLKKVKDEAQHRPHCKLGP